MSFILTYIPQHIKCKYYSGINTKILKSKISIQLKIDYWKRLVDDFVTDGVPDL